MKDRGKAATAITALLFFCLILFCGPAAGSPSSPGTPVLDGVIGEGEYEHAADLSDGDFLLRWQFHDDKVFFAMTAMTDGYLAIGFDPEFLMKGADMVVGWVDEDGNATVIDAYSSGQFGPVVQDMDHGGTYDILGHAGASSGGWTVIEFSRVLSTGDQYDNEIPSDGELVVMWATGSVFDPATMPDDGGIGTISMSSGETSESAPIYPYLIAFVMVALASSIVALLMLRGPAKLRRRGHLVLGAVTAGLMSCAALIILLTGIAETPAEMAYPLLVATASVVITAAIGTAVHRRDGRPWLNKGHALSGAGSMVAMAWCLLSTFWL